MRLVHAMTCAVLAFAAGAPAQPCAQSSFCYQNFNLDQHLSDLSLVGSAWIPDGTIWLTPAQEGQGGAAWYRNFRPNVAQPWYTSFNFRVSGQGDGMAFVIQNDHADTIGGGGSDLGYAGIPHSLAVEFDTFAFSGEFPEDHCSIQTNFAAPNSSGDGSSLAHHDFAYDINDGEWHTAFIAYDGTTLHVIVDRQTILTQAVDFTNGIADADGCAFVGFTAATGGAFGLQEIGRWTFGQNGPIFPDFSGAPALSLNGSTSLAGDRLRLTDGPDQAGSVHHAFIRPVVTEPWCTTFGLQWSDEADGVAFIIQNCCAFALGSPGSGLGYDGIPRSIVVEFDTYSFSGEYPADHVSIQTNFSGPNSADDASSLVAAFLPIDLNDGLPHEATICYDGTSLHVTVNNFGVVSAGVLLNDMADANGTALVGFTGGTGGAFGNQDVLYWGFGSQGDCRPTDFMQFIPDQNVPAGSDLTVAFSASGSDPRTYEWRLNGDVVNDGGPISGASTNTLTISPVGPEHAGIWDYSASNACSGIGTSFVLTIEGGGGCDPDYDQNGVADQDDVAYLINVVSGGDNPTERDPDFDLNGVADQDDVARLIDVIAGGPCP